MLAAVVEIVWPLIVISSTTKEVNPSISVVAVAPKTIVWPPINTWGFAKLAFVIPAVPDKLAFVNEFAWISTLLSVTSVSKPGPPANVNVLKCYMYLYLCHLLK